MREGRFPTVLEFSKLPGYSATINSVPDQKTTAQRLDDIEAKLDSLITAADYGMAKLDRLVALAEQAEKFLHNPIGAYKAARLGKLPSRDPAV